MDPRQITYGELKSFKEKISSYNTEEFFKLYLEHLEAQEKEEVIQKVLEMFPKFEGLRLELDFIDKRKTMAVVTVFRNEEIVGYIGYNNDYGILGTTFYSFDKAILACLCKKYFSGKLPPLNWLFEMFAIPDTINTVTENNPLKLKEGVPLKENKESEEKDV